MKGRIIKVISNDYTVKLDNNIKVLGIRENKIRIVR